jgi:GNAT superfamily N-acetyltransferase
VRIEPLSDANTGAWVELFEACGCSCFCRWWHFEGSKNDWLARCFHEKDENREEQLAMVRAGAPEARGLLALEGDRAIGWMKLAPRARLTKLTRQGAYRPLDLGDAEGVWSIGCLLVRPEERRRGAARALVSAAEEHVRAWGGRAVEAYPRRAEGPLHDEEAWMGTAALFESLGYVRVTGEPPYPVMRKAV